MNTKVHSTTGTQPLIIRRGHQPGTVHILDVETGAGQLYPAAELIHALYTASGLPVLVAEPDKWQQVPS